MNQRDRVVTLLSLDSPMVADHLVRNSPYPSAPPTPSMHNDNVACDLQGEIGCGNATFPCLWFLSTSLSLLARHILCRHAHTHTQQEDGRHLMLNQLPLPVPGAQLLSEVVAFVVPNISSKLELALDILSGLHVLSQIRHVPIHTSDSQRS